MYCILGCGGHARSIADILLAKSIEDFIFVDDNAQDDEYIYEHKVLKEIPDGYENEKFFLAIGSNKKREKFYKQLKNKKYMKIISNCSYISPYSKIGEGVLIANYVHIGPSVYIGNQTIINTGTVIEHECEIGDFCHVAPRTVVCGRSKIGNSVFIGAGSVVIDSIKICSNVIIGANSTVLKNIEESGVYVGTPAKKIR